MRKGISGLILFMASLACVVHVSAQERLPLSTLSLESMGAFQGPAPNWDIAGDIQSDRDKRWSLQAMPGTGILVNLVTEDANDNLFTRWTHGDLELELEVLMPRGSNSGIYLQGRYEVQLLDSWGVQAPTFGDIGGLYQRWDDSRPPDQRGYEGHPPRQNASRAPGLWQHVKIIFQAPRFDAGGTKIANALFVSVELNGVVIHENVEITGPTRAASFTDEQPEGPLMLQGDHGPVAFRNIRYKRYAQDRVTTSPLTYRFFDGRFEQIPDLTGLFADEEGQVEGLTWKVRESNTDTFLVQFAGTLTVPTTGLYRFILDLDWLTGDPHFQDKKIGGGTLHIANQTALTHPGHVRSGYGDIVLDAGTHPFTLTYFKNRRWHGPRIALYVEGPDTPLHTLNTPGSLPDPSTVGAILVAPEQEPTIVRSFINHLGEKRTHAVSVGEPEGPHYSLDVSQTALLHLWRGPFLDATPMWHSRGQDQLSIPQGSTLTLSGQPSLAFLDQENTPWPDSVDHATPYRFLGYDLDGDGRPTFRYVIGDVPIEDQMLPDPEARYLTRRLVVQTAEEDAPLWLRLASGSTIQALTDGSYVVDDRSYYIVVEDAPGAPRLRTTEQGQELLLRIPHQDASTTIIYSIVW